MMVGSRIVWFIMRFAILAAEVELIVLVSWKFMWDSVPFVGFWNFEDMIF